jgi:hypothetical protein
MAKCRLQLAQFAGVILNRYNFDIELYILNSTALAPFNGTLKRKENIFLKKCNKTSSGGIFSSFNSLRSSNKLISVQAYLTHALVIDDLILDLAAHIHFRASFLRRIL